MYLDIGNQNKIVFKFILNIRRV